MTYQIFSIRDSKTNIYYPPQFRTNEGEAQRDFHALINDPQSIPGKYPADYSMWHLGTYDSDSGAINPITPQKLFEGDQLKGQNLS